MQEKWLAQTDASVVLGCNISVDFIAKEFDEVNRVVIAKAELLEFSFAPIPANQSVALSQEPQTAPLPKHMNCTSTTSFTSEGGGCTAMSSYPKRREDVPKMNEIGNRIDGARSDPIYAADLES